ncbi:MAG: hypothetical protein JXA33_02680, partial [Anaerolineae bacterium]|nr:hypothetical protein [Anaerolineae bacterium]
FHPTAGERTALMGNSLENRKLANLKLTNYPLGALHFLMCFFAGGRSPPAKKHIFPAALAALLPVLS